MKKLEAIDFVGAPVTDLKHALKEINVYRHVQEMILNSRKMARIYNNKKKYGENNRNTAAR